MYFGSSPGELGGTVSLGVPLPVIDRGQGSIAAALARSEAAEASRSAQQLQAQQTVSATWREAVARQQAFVDNSENLLRPGMFVQALVETKLAAAVDVPVSAVLARRDQFFVFIQAADGLSWSASSGCISTEQIFIGTKFPSKFPTRTATENQPRRVQRTKTSSKFSAGWPKAP